MPGYNTLIITAIAVFGFFAGLYLFVLEKREQDSSRNMHWSAVYLIDPESSNMNFALENHEGKEMLYVYTIFNKDNNVLSKAEIKLSPGEKKEIEISYPESAVRVQINYNGQEKNLTTKNTVNKIP